jgi:menaquinone-specific isochorismate synthase
VLPTFTAVQRGRDGWLLVAAREGSTPAERGELAATAEHLVAELRTATLRELAAPRLLRRRDSEPDRWQQGVAAICTAIAAGELKKVVTARSSDLELDREIALDQVLDRLAHECPECTRFLVRRRGVAFVGATPERLVSRRGRRVTSEALAGSMPIATGAGEGSPHERLLACAKNRGEHQLVVDSIREALAPLCVSLDVAEAPSVVALRHVLHLSSPFSGMLADDTHVLELVDALHPTPAVGGAPKVAALRWIAENEPLDRGWYAGPVGWFDGSGDGDLAVAIRSALVHGASARVFAGAGVVAGSEPSSELRETVLKQRAMVHGLGLEWECDGCFGPS